MGERLAIRASRVFDGESLRGAAMVLVDDGRITAVDTTGAAPPDHTTVVELHPAMTLLPGLIDAHAHLAFDATLQAAASFAAADDEQLRGQVKRAAESALRAGVTTVRDLGDRNYLTVEFALAAATPGAPPLPEIIAAGPPITTPGGHFAMMGGEASGHDELRAAVRARAYHGCQFVKVMASGGNMSPQTKPWLSQYSVDDLRVIADEAHELGLRVAAHAHATSAIADSADAGIDTIEHATFYTEEGVELDMIVVERLLQRGTFVSMTAGVVPGAPPPPPQIAQRLPKMIENMGVLRESGVRLIFGPDSGIAPGKPHHVLPYAVQQMGEFGFPSIEALRSATSLAAEACGVAGRKGRIIPGADADLLVVDGDPTSDLAALHNVTAVLRAGRFAVPLTPVASGARG